MSMQTMIFFRRNEKISLLFFFHEISILSGVKKTVNFIVLYFLLPSVTGKVQGGPHSN